MPLNAEERMAHEKYKREQKQYSRPTIEQLEIARLHQQLEHAQNTISYLDDYIDKQTEKIDRINGHIRYYEVHKRSAGVTLDAIRAVLR